MRKILLMPLLAVLLGCNFLPSDDIDPSGKLSRDDYRRLQTRADDATARPREAGPPIPALAAPMPTPAPVALGADRLVTVSVTDDVPLREVLARLAREAGLNLELDPRVTGGVIFSAYDQPLDVVLKRLTDLAGLRYTLADGFLRIEPDDPVTRHYQLDYLNLARNAEGDVAIATNVFNADIGGDGKTSSQSADNNSTARIRSTSQADLWGEIERNLGTLLTETKDKGKEGRFSLNRQAGVLSVTATSKQHDTIKAWLDQLRRRVNSQVLIEARILEVELRDEYRSGINWRSLFDNSLNLAARFGTSAVGGPFLTAATATDGVFTASLKTEDMAGILNLVREFGTTRILSSPRLTVLNNQTAVLKVARNEVYFTTSAQFPTTVTSGGVPIAGTPVFTSTPRTVPVGLVMTVQPAIDPDHQDITLTLRPTISRVVDRVDDPSIGLNAAASSITTSVRSQIPVLAVREMDSVLRLPSGAVAVMGGLMQDSSENNQQGVPPFDEAPLLGDLAKSRDHNGTITELVILLRATIVDQTRADTADAALYRDYGRDPRPLPMPEDAIKPPPDLPAMTAPKPPVASDSEPQGTRLPKPLVRRPTVERPPAKIIWE